MKWMIAALFFAQTLVAQEPQLRCEKKWGELNWEGVVFHRYVLRAEHFPPKQLYRLIVRSFDGTQTETFRYFANHRGHLILKPPENLQGEIYAICPAVRGERLTFLMQAEENGGIYSTDLIPFPLEMRSAKGIKLSLELKGAQGEKFLLFAQGFDPREKITLSLQMDATQIDIPCELTPLGDLCALIDIPVVAAGGKATIFVSRKKERIAFRFEWGELALKMVGACCFEIK